MQTSMIPEEKFTPIQKEIDQTKTKLKELETAQREMQVGGQIETDSTLPCSPKYGRRAAI